PANIASIDQKMVGDASAVEIALIGDVDVHSFREDKNYNVDVAFQQPEKAPAPPPAADVSHAPAPAAPGAARPSAGRSGACRRCGGSGARQARRRSRRCWAIQRARAADLGD